MAYAERFNTALPAADELRRAAVSAGGILREILARWRAWRARRALSGYPDAMLKDIGVNRGAIDNAVRDGRPKIGRRRLR
jgi:uncharacterized protein YjiS (DUF1127 family)